MTLKPFEIDFYNVYVRGFDRIRRQFRIPKIILENKQKIRMRQ